MNTVVTTVMGAAVLLGMTVIASAQRVTPAPTPPPIPAANLTTQAPYTSTNPNQGVEQARPLFHIGKLPGVIWAPVEPPYNSKLNGTQAANPLWNSDAF
jgi:hypothetical protein